MTVDITSRSIIYYNHRIQCHSSYSIVPNEIRSPYYSNSSKECKVIKFNYEGDIANGRILNVMGENIQYESKSEIILLRELGNPLLNENYEVVDMAASGTAALVNLHKQLAKQLMFNPFSLNTRNMF